MSRPVIVGERAVTPPLTLGDLQKTSKRYEGHCFYLDDFGLRIAQWTQITGGTFRLINLETGNRLFDQGGPSGLALTPVRVTMTVERTS